MRQPKTNTLQKPTFKLKPSDAFTPTRDDDNRIDWERKNKKKKSDDEAILEAPVEILELDPDDDEVLSIEVRHKTKAPKKGKKDKRRQLVLDEDTGRVFVKRRRKSNRHYEWDEYE
ncbi:MAG: hypothetical protein MUF87_18885 [Anaerolineae bacterium]|jgi:hypothetical protein|nr:hypothetical protein [Anaerolineae bacterium]